MKTKSYFKKLFSFMVVILIGQFVFASSGFLKGQKNIQYVSTKWFEIIYPEGSQLSAADLALSADSIYEDICLQYGISPQFRMPVVITASTDVFNAYYSNYSSNHIVLLDSVPSQNMAVNDSVIIDTFRHELTHAVTINMRNKFFQRLCSILGDSINYGYYFTMPSLINEGATISYESMYGKGRLNDGFYLQTIRQAKIEKKFPSWSDVLGARDTYPSKDTAYAFGGPFASWLQNKYGMQKYAEFWYTAINMKELTLNSTFKKTYGLSLTKAWKEFEQSIDNLNVQSNPLDTDGVEDFFNNLAQIKSNKFSTQNGIGEIYTDLTECDNGIAYLDSSANSVMFTEKNKEGCFSKPRKLFSKQSMNDISFSSDGKFLAISFYDINQPVLKTGVGILNIGSGKFIRINETGLRNAIIQQDNGNYFLVATKTFSQQMSLVVYQLDVDNKMNITDYKEIRSQKLIREDVISSMCDGGNGKLACIYKNKMNWSIRIITGLLGNETLNTIEYTMPMENIRARNISCVDKENQIYSFSWVLPNTLPRLGYLINDVNENKSYFSLMDIDISGGINNPIAYRIMDSNRNQLPSVSFIGCFYEDNKILAMNSAKLPFNEYPIDSVSVEFFNKENERTISLSVLQNAKPYHDTYNKRGLLYPLATVPQFDSSLTNSMNITFPGVTYITDTVTNSDIFAVSAGYDLFMNSYGIFMEFKGGTQTSLFSYDIQNALTFDEYYFKQAYNEINVSSGIRLGNLCSLIVSDTNELFAGRFQESINLLSDHDLCKEGAGDTDNFFILKNNAALSISNMHKSGAGNFNKTGITLYLNYLTMYESLLNDEYDSKNFYFNFYPSIQLKLPYLLPIKCVYGKTYNFPISCSVAVVPNKDNLLTYNAEAIVFSSEVQKGMGVFPFYLCRYTLSVGYFGQLKHGNDSFEIFKIVSDFNDMTKCYRDDCLEAKLLIETKINTGAFVISDTVLKLGFKYRYLLDPAQNKRHSFAFVGSFDI